MSKKDRSFHFNGIEDWMEQFLEDPFTSFIDQYQFRVDLFETDREYIVEAVLANYTKNQLFVKVEDDTIIIQAPHHQKEETLERLINLPFDLTYKKVQAYYVNHILEITIKKEESIENANTFIAIK